MPNNEIKSLREEIERIKSVIRIAYIYIDQHRHGKAKSILFDSGIVK